MSTPRYRELDGLRGIAALSVVLFHFFSLYDVYFRPGVAPPPVRFSQGFYGVHLFFLISGYVILLTARRSSRPADFAIARLSRLFPTYWVCLTLSWVIVAVLGVDRLLRTPLQIAANYSMLQRFAGIRSVDGVYWSLSVELIFYVVVFVALAVTGGVRPGTVRRLASLWLAVSLVIAAVAHLRPGSGAVHLVAVASVAEYAALFCCGMALLESRGTGRLDPLVSASVATAFATTWLFEGLGPAAIVAALCVGFAAVVTSRGCAPLRWAPLVFLGEVSYPLYLLHQNLGYAFMEQVVPSLGRTWAAVTAVLLAVGLAWVVHVFVEVPVSRWVRRGLGHVAIRRG